MNEREATDLVLDAIEDLGLTYMIVGSLASNAYGVPRATQDADIVVQLKADSISKIEERLGGRLRIDPQAKFETVTGTTKFDLHLPDPVFTIEIFSLTDDPFDQCRFRRRVQAVMEGRRRFMPTAEDVITQKLRWSRQGMGGKDIEDARNVIAVQRERLDWDYIREWCRKLGLGELLDTVVKSIPPLD